MLKQNKNHWPAEEPSVCPYPNPESAMLPLKSSCLSGCQPIWVSWWRNPPPLPLPRGQFQLPRVPGALLPSGKCGQQPGSANKQWAAGLCHCSQQCCPMAAPALLQLLIPVPLGAQVCLGTREFVGIQHGLLTKHIRNITKLNVNALEIQMPACVFISPVLLRHTGEGSWLTVGFSGVPKLSVFWHLIAIATLLILADKLALHKRAQVCAKYPSLAHYCDKSILQACCQLEGLSSWSANFDNNQFNKTCYISRWSGNEPQGDEKPAELLLTIRQNCCLHAAFAWAKAFLCTGPSPSVLSLQEVHVT